MIDKSFDFFFNTCFISLDQTHITSHWLFVQIMNTEQDW